MPDNYKKENYLIKKIEPFKAKKVKNLDDLSFFLEKMILISLTPTGF